MKLKEVFDKPYPYTWHEKGGTDDDWSADAVLDDGSQLRINFYPMVLDGSKYEINFQRAAAGDRIRHRDFGATGGGDEIRIFGTVVAAIKEWYNWQKNNRVPHKDEPLREIEFHAAKDEAVAKGRTALYHRFAKKFAAAAGMDLLVGDLGDQTTFVLKKFKKKKRVAEDGKIVKGVNTTVDVKTGETKRQAAKFGNKVNSKNEPPLLHSKAKKNTNPHVLSNLGLAESTMITELFNEKYDWTWKLNQGSDRTAVFDTEDGDFVNADFREHRHAVNFDFGRNGSANVTGDGDAYRIFATIFDIIANYLAEEKPDRLTFGAEKNPQAGAKQMSRINLYKRMVNKFAASVGYNAKFDDHGIQTRFTLTRDGLVESKKSGETAYKLQLVRDGDEDVLRVLSNKSPSWVEIRGKQNYETDGYDPKDKLHSFLNKLDPATVSALMSGDTKFLNPNNSRTTPSIKQAKHIMSTEEIKKPHPNDTLGVKRHEMPQVHAQHYPELYKYLTDHGATMSKGNISATKLKAVQSEFSDEGVEKMMRKGGVTGDGTKKPLIVSSDNYIIDGHHRWLAAYNLKEVVPIIKVSLPVKKLLELVRDFRHTTYKDIYNEEGSQNEKTTRTRRSNRNRGTNERRST